MTVLSDGMVGFTTSCVNAECVVSAGSSANALTLSIFVIVIALIIKLPSTVNPHQGNVSYMRKLAAFALDFTFLGAMIIAPLAALPLSLEALHTGEFEWSFYREYARITDWISVIAILMMFVGLHFYYLRPALRGTQTLGQYIAGFRVVLQNNKWRTLSGRFFLMSACMGIMPMFMVSISKNMRASAGLSNNPNPFSVFDIVTFERVKNCQQG